MTVGILALQGAFVEHEQMLKKLGVGYIELRQKKDLDNKIDALILPGGESTVQGKLLKELDMFDTIQSWIQGGMPVLATCAGMILLSEAISNDNRRYFGTLPVTVRRNAYGRQLGSFYTEATFDDMENVPMTFIRAPFIEKASDKVEILARVNDDIVAVRYQNQIAMSFHPELNEDQRIYRMFLESA